MVRRFDRLTTAQAHHSVKQEIEKGCRWFCDPDPVAEEAFLSPTRDVFQARLDTMYRTLLNQTRNESEVALLTAVVGEIGNNCFDHNLGQWRDSPGCWYHYSLEGPLVMVLVADRGQGIMASLKRVQPDLKNDREALDIAFEKRISGRSPERRGNGLKFVRGVINGNPKRGVWCVSGKGRISFGGLFLKMAEPPLPPSLEGSGTLSLVLWGMNEN